jgi:hypothetical protein
MASVEETALELRWRKYKNMERFSTNDTQLLYLALNDPDTFRQIVLNRSAAGIVEPIRIAGVNFDELEG